MGRELNLQAYYKWMVRRISRRYFTASKNIPMNLPQRKTRIFSRNSESCSIANQAVRIDPTAINYGALFSRLHANPPRTVKKRHIRKGSMAPGCLGRNSWLIATISAMGAYCHGILLIATRPSIMFFTACRFRRKIHTRAAHRRQRHARHQQRHHRASHDPPQTHTITIRPTRRLGCSPAFAWHPVLQLT